MDTSALGHAFADGAVVAKRNLIKIKRVPEVMVFVLISPIMFVLLFAYVFGASTEIPGMDHREYLIVPSVEVIDNASFIVIMPLTFISNAFINTRGLPTPLRVFADWNPLSAVTQASRELFGNTGTLPISEAWSMQNPIVYTLLWIGIILVVFVPLSIRQYKRSTTPARVGSG